PGDALVVDRPHRRLVRERVTEDDALGDEPRELGDELLAHVAVDEQALAGGAALPGAEEARHLRLGDGQVDVGVVHDDHGPVAAELEHGRLAGGRLGHTAAGLGRADEADPGPVTRLKTPGGRSASATQFASAMPAIAVVDAGVHTTVLPEASAGAISSAGIVYGQFHGVITPMTPRGRRTSRTRLPGALEL